MKSLSRHLKHGEGGPGDLLSAIRQFPGTSGTGMGHQPDPLSSPEALILGTLTDDKSMFAHFMLGRKIQSARCVRGNKDSTLLPAKAGCNLWRHQIRSFISPFNAWRWGLTGSGSGRPEGDPTAAGASVNQVECVWWLIQAVGKTAACTFSFSCLPLIPGIAGVLYIPEWEVPTWKLFQG